MNSATGLKDVHIRVWGISGLEFGVRKSGFMGYSRARGAFGLNLWSASLEGECTCIPAVAQVWVERFLGYRV